MVKASNACKTKQNQALLDGPELHQGVWKTLVEPSETKLFSAALRESQPFEIA